MSKGGGEFKFINYIIPEIDFLQPKNQKKYQFREP